MKKSHNLSAIAISITEPVDRLVRACGEFSLGVASDSTNPVEIFCLCVKAPALLCSHGSNVSSFVIDLASALSFTHRLALGHVKVRFTFVGV